MPPQHCAKKQSRQSAMSHASHFAMMLVFMLNFLLGTIANPSAPYGTRSKCYKVVSRVTQGLANSAFCKNGPPSEFRVCAMNIDDANSRARAIETEIRGLNTAVCNKQTQDFCKSLGFSSGACPNAAYRCSSPFKNECTEDADCKVPLYVCCATCEAETSALRCEGFTEKLIDAYCQVIFISFCSAISQSILKPLSENSQVPSSETLCLRCWQFSTKNGLIHSLYVDRGHHYELKLFVQNKRSYYKAFTSGAQGTNTGRNSRLTATSWIQSSK